MSVPWQHPSNQRRGLCSSEWATDLRFVSLCVTHWNSYQNPVLQSRNAFWTFHWIWPKAWLWKITTVITTGNKLSYFSTPFFCSFCLSVLIIDLIYKLITKWTTNAFKTCVFMIWFIICIFALKWAQKTADWKGQQRQSMTSSKGRKRKEWVKKAGQYGGLLHNFLALLIYHLADLAQSQHPLASVMSELQPRWK